jgi:glycosyltransferase involved in cell wall biosynthesis
MGGSGPLRDRLEKQAIALGIGGSVTFLGRVDDRVLPLAYGACDAFVLPTAELECFGLIALEALSSGRPVLATPVGAIPEVIAEFELSWLARSARTSDIADLLRQFLTGKLPDHPPAKLNKQVCRKYSRSLVLDEFLKTSIGIGRKCHFAD